MTERLYYHDAYLSAFRAQVAEIADDGRRVYLDRTAFYPSSGGQPFDTGTLAGVAVLDVIDEGEHIAHILAAPFQGTEAECAIDWPRRFDHMQQHTGQHLLSAVLEELYHARTVSFHLGEESCTIDVGAAALTSEQVRAAERRANALITRNCPVTVQFADASGDLGLRKASQREGELRVIEIEGIDRSACGGTHVRQTGEIGPLLIRKLDKIRGDTRIEFLCGSRAVARARADYDALAQISRTLSLPLDETPAAVAAQQERLNESEKASQKLRIELVKRRGRELYEATLPDAAGVRRVTCRPAALDDETRILAQSFCAQPLAVFSAVVEMPPALLLCVSNDSGIHAGNVLKAALNAVGGRGGGNAQLAQGSVPSLEALKSLENSIA